MVNDAIRDRPEDMVVAVHLCRGNFKSAWVAKGGYEPVAEILFNEMAIDGFFLEYDDERSGDFAPLRHMPKGKTVVLGLMSSKSSRWPWSWAFGFSRSGYQPSSLSLIKPRSSS